ncbi:hypothetical protein TRFO_39301 [Tritrichomonas foetus]|uniref:Condensation domain-containing protein n=1 Tax=Tritrichomonas foetus TaxID=1144522 RepID=A0A1J4JBA7_9EUKA|nr:hypothetical protein TRFO_39301 [Tritrichomonas foetus]|eukprot:OHS94532.1 hypothetical protein TRFO_39301 [Tritrichomonas foetus]
MSFSKKIPPESAMWRKFNSFLQFGLEFDTSSAVDQALEYFSKSVIGLRTRWTETAIESGMNEIQIHKLPRHFDLLQDAAKYTFQHFTPNFSDAVGSIAYNDRQVVLNVAHLASDGGYFRFLIENFGKIPKNLPPFKVENEDAFKDLIDKSPTDVKGNLIDENLTRVFSHDEKNINHLEYDQYLTKYWKPSDFKFDYNPKTRAPQKLTEKTYLANFFAACAQERHLMNSFGMNTVVDLRKWLSVPVNFDHLSMIAFISPYIKNVTPDMNLSQFAQIMRKSLNDKLARHEQFGIFHSPQNGKIIPGNYFEISNIGPIKIKKPITNLWISMEMKAYERYTIANMGFSVDDGQQNNLVTRFRWNPHTLSPDEARRMEAVVNHVIGNVSFDRTIGDVYEEAKEVYKQ